MPRLVKGMTSSWFGTPFCIFLPLFQWSIINGSCLHPSKIYILYMLSRFICMYTIHTFTCEYIHIWSPPQDLPKSFFNGICNTQCIFSYTQFHYNFERDLRLLDVTKHGKTQYISTCIHPNCQKTTCFLTCFFTIWVLPLQNVSNFTKNY